MAERSYQPANGTEGRDFMARFCDRCQRDAKFRQTMDGEDGCPILGATQIYEIDHPKYPREWIIDEDGTRCTAFEPEVRHG